MTYCSSSTNQAAKAAPSQIGVYECEVKLKFRLIEESLAHCDREQLLQLLVDAFSYGSDEYLESLHTEVAVQEISELEASPSMRRQLIRLRSASCTK
ncbi:MAG TPA: Npun_R1517 family heterocyst differentiation transcriptional regulator [Candidatus Obscuribacterales bacterium]